MAERLLVHDEHVGLLPGAPCVRPAEASPTSTAPRRPAFRADIQGLRAVAVLLVVLYHAKLGLTGGYVGVDVFFVISGFLITRLLVKELRSERRISLLGFYARRVRRILPAATVTLIAVTLAARVLLAPESARRALVDALSAVLYGANFRFAIEGANYLNATLPPSPLVHFWSLGVEEQFYLAWPLLIGLSSLVWLAPRLGRRAGVRARLPRGARGAVRRAPALWVVCLALLCLAGASFAFSLHETVVSPPWAYYSIFTRGWELAAGCLAALVGPRVARLGRTGRAQFVWPLLAWAGLGAIAWAGFGFSSLTPYPGTAALVPVGGALALILAGGAAPRLGAARLLGTRTFQWVGAVSYSWYLWHWPFLFFAPHVLGHPLSVPGTMVVISLSLGVAAASYYFVEEPFRRASFAVKRPGLSVAGAFPMLGASLAVIAASTLTLPQLQAPGRAAHPNIGKGGTLTLAQLEKDLKTAVHREKVPVNLQPRLEAARTDDAWIVRDGCSLQRQGLQSKPCFLGDRRSKVTVALLGDSHAAVWAPALVQISKQEHWRLADFTKSSCPPVPVHLVNYPQCATWRAHAEAQIAALHPALVVVSWARLEGGVAKRDRKPDQWARAMGSLVSSLKAHSRQVLYISDAPTMRDHVPECLSGHLKSVTDCNTPRRKALQLPRVKAALIKAAKGAGAHVLDPTPWFCAPRICPVIVGNIVLYRDNAHMTPAYSKFLTPLLAHVVEPLVKKVG